MMNKRNLEIDALRGIACILLVAFHVIGNTPRAGLKIDTGFYRDFNDLLAYIRMPLFTFLSGIAYSYRPFSSGLFLFIQKKIRRLIIPMLTVGTLFAWVQFVIPGTNAKITHWSTLHIYPVAHFWFLEAIFLIFCFIVVCEIFKLFDSIQGFFIVFCLSVAVYLSSFEMAMFSISGAIYLLPYFLLGMFYQRYHYKDTLTPNTRLFLCVASLLLLAFIEAGLIPHYGRRTLLALIVGMLTCSFGLSLKLKSDFLAKIGSYSYSIYLFHVFFTASVRILLKKFHIGDTHILFSICLIFGIMGPIFTEIILNGTNFTRMAFLGKGPTEEKYLWFTGLLSRML